MSRTFCNYLIFSNGRDLHPTFYGNLAGSSNTGNYVTFVGAEAGTGGNTGTSNTFVGQRTGWKNTSGQSNTFAGRNAGAYNTEGSYNTFIGRAAGFENKVGSSNTFVGCLAGFSTTTFEGTWGVSNTFVGDRAGHDNTNGTFNTFVGKESGRKNTTGLYNTSLGYKAGYSEKTSAFDQAWRNTFIGANTGFNNANGDYNTFIGSSAGYSNEDGRFNIFIGRNAGYNEKGSYKLYIDSSDTSNPLIWGDFEAKKVVINGDFRAIATAGSSDRRWKKKIKPLESSLEKVSNLQGVSYEWRVDEYPDISMTEGKQIGLVAQDVEKELPELVSEDKDGYKAVSYSKLTAVLVEAIKELKYKNDKKEMVLIKLLKREQARNEKQQAEIEELRSMIKELKS